MVNVYFFLTKAGNRDEKFIKLSADAKKIQDKNKKKGDELHKKQCPFKPEINKKSLAMRRELDVYSHLYK